MRLGQTGVTRTRFTGGIAPMTASESIGTVVFVVGVGVLAFTVYGAGHVPCRYLCRRQDGSATGELSAGLACSIDDYAVV